MAQLSNTPLAPLFFGQAQNQFNWMVHLRRELHAHPELGFDLPWTAGRIEKELQALDLEPKVGIGRTGIVVDIIGAHPGPKALLRADMDALPIFEETGLSFASTIPGRMHACGHDLHSAALLGAIKIVNDNKNLLCGSVRFIFQPAEETTESGAAAMIADGVLEGVDFVVGLHNMPHMNVNTVQLVDGPVFASCDNFSVTVTGKSGHGAYPHQTVDPIVGAASIIMQLQSLASRKMDPTDPFIVSIGQISGGGSENIIPETCSFSGTTRSLSAAARQRIETEVKNICEHGAQAMGLTAKVEWRQCVPSMANDPLLLDTADRVLKSHFQTLAEFEEQLDVIRKARIDFISEDFALFGEQRPALFALVGSQTEGRQDALHNADYQPNEDFLKTAAATFALLAFELNSSWTTKP